MKQQTKRLLKSLCMAVGIILLSAVDPLAGYAAERTITLLPLLPIHPEKVRKHY